MERYAGRTLAMVALGSPPGAVVDPTAIVALQRAAGNYAVAAALQDGGRAKQDEEEELRKGPRATSTDRDLPPPVAPSPSAPSTGLSWGLAGRSAGWGRTVAAENAPRSWGTRLSARAEGSQSPSWAAG